MSRGLKALGLHNISLEVRYGRAEAKRIGLAHLKIRSSLAAVATSCILVAGGATEAVAATKRATRSRLRRWLRPHLGATLTKRLQRSSVFHSSASTFVGLHHCTYWWSTCWWSQVNKYGAEGECRETQGHGWAQGLMCIRTCIPITAWPHAWFFAGRSNHTC